jgi:hypothetical protein
MKVLSLKAKSQAKASSFTRICLNTRGTLLTIDVKGWALTKLNRISGKGDG